jgi:hypothetical protein
MALSNDEIKQWAAQQYQAYGPSMTSKQVVNEMAKAGISADQYAAALGLSQPETAATYNTILDDLSHGLGSYLDLSGSNLAQTYSDANAHPADFSNQLVDLVSNHMVNNDYQKQLGQLASDPEMQAAIDSIYNGPGYSATVKGLNNSQGGYNYDTQDIVAAYRQAYGRNPTEEEYVTAMAKMGLDNFDRSSLGGGQNTSANVAALESDPYAGRYAGYNPYDLPQDAVNVSQNVLGDSVQFTNPVTQRPMVASFDNGQLVVKDGQDTMTGAEAAAAVGLALATGGLNQKDYSAIQADLKAAKSMNDVYAAFSKPQAVAAIDPKFGAQTGVGKTLQEAQANSGALNDLIAQLGLQNDGRMPSNASISKAASDAGVPYQFDQSLYQSLYDGQLPSTTNDVIDPGSYKSKFQLQDLSNAVKQMFTTGTGPTETASAADSFGGWKDRTNFGSSDGTLMGAGNANYNSSLIKSLRQNSMTPISTNPGVNIVPNQGVESSNWTPPSGTGSAFNPQVMNPRAATPQEVNDYNAYSAYRSSSVGASQPYLSLTDWIAQGRPTGVNNNTSNSTNTSNTGQGGSGNGNGAPTTGGNEGP